MIGFVPGPHQWGAPPARANSLFVGGVRQVRARYPNGNPQDETGICFSSTNHPGEGCPGYLTAHGGAGGTLPAGSKIATVSAGPDRGKSPRFGCSQCEHFGSFQYSIYDPPAGHPVYNKPLPGLGWQNNSLFAQPPNPLARPAGVRYNNDLANKTYVDASTGVVHMFHGNLWGGWQYQVASQQANTSSLLFGYGGWQEARGSSISSNHYFVENLLEELDSPGEWYLDPKPQVPMLYLLPNTSASAPRAATKTATRTAGTAAEKEVGSGAGPGLVLGPMEVVIPVLDTLVSLTGTTNASFEGFEFTETRATFFNMYEVPSGGDWSVHRGATFLVQQGCDNIRISGCAFNQTGGNGMMLSSGVTNSVVEGNEFLHIGDSAILLLGRTNGVDGTYATYPNHNTIKGNHMHEVGVYGKQTSCIFQAIAANSTIIGNVCYNGPRAGYVTTWL